MNRDIAPRGKQRGKVLEWAFMTAQTGTHYINVKFETESGHAVYWMGFFTPYTIDRTIESLRYCGWTGDDIERMTEDGMGSLKPQLVIEHEEYEGKVRARVAWVNNGDGSASMKGAMDGAELKAFAAEMRSKIRGAQAVARQSQPVRQEFGDDDIPF